MTTKSKDNLPKLQEGWVWSKLGECVEKITLTGKKLKQKDYQLKGKLPVVDQGQNFIGGYTNKEDCRISCTSPVIVFGDHTRVFKYVDFDFVAGADGVTALEPLEIFYPKLFFYFAQAIILPSKGYARHYQFLEKSHIPLPPLPEQHRIVEKIEELFSRLDAGIEELRKVKAEIKRYRQSVLKAAFEGRLTAEWREQHKDELEPASVLLERIKEERKKKEGKKHKELPPVNTTGLPELPLGWEWSITLEVCSSVRDGTHDTPKYVLKGVPLITSKNLKETGLDFINTKEISTEDHDKISVRSGVDTGDVLFAMIGTIGNPVVVKTDKTFSIKNVGLFKKNLDVIIPEYLMCWLSSPVFQMIAIEQELIKGTTQKFIPLGNLRSIPVPYTSLQEQHRVKDEIERLFSIANEVELEVDKSLKEAGRLRQSILKRAFEGKLVPQDPNDEPAVRLIERIREERARLAEKKKISKSRPRKATKRAQA